MLEAYQVTVDTVNSYMNNGGFTADPHFSENILLYLHEAEQREKLVENTHYDLLLSFLKDPETTSSTDTVRGKAFYGHIDVHFELTEAFEKAKDDDLFLNYHGFGVKNINLNGHSLDASKYFHHQRIYFDRKILKLRGSNQLSVTFKSKYRNDGEGPHLFKDSEDNAEYIYTQFEAFYANRAFPVFDQPDIKATLKFRAIAPEDWTVIGNGKDIATLKKGDRDLDLLLNSTDPSLVSSATEEYKLTEFAETKKIATYLYAFMAGKFDFTERNMKIKGLSDPLRMRLYFRKSVRKDVERIQEYMFEPVARAMEWYSDYFSQPFPFDKFDQIYCPEFKYGAMENVGAVTYTEVLLFRGKELTEADKTSIINTALHELAHMWFGNLVTMHWWNDLWLNEAFATYISYYAMSDIKDIQQVVPSLWIQVNAFKGLGYHDDELSTAHPIYNSVSDTDMANSVIDGITYGKGCAFLQQMQHLIGHQTFEQACKIYFEKHAWKNTYLQDFIDSLVEAHKQQKKNKVDIEVSAWSKNFLNTKGVNTLEIIEGSNKTLVLRQTLGEFSSSLLEQKLNILIFDEKLVTKTISIMTSSTKNDVELPLSAKDAKNKMFIINDGDKAYSRVLLDEATSKFLSKNLFKFDDIITRTLVWKGLTGMIKARKIKSSLLFEFIENNLRAEKHPVLLKTILNAAKGAVELYVPNEDFSRISSNMFELLYDIILNTKTKEILDILNESIFNFLDSK